MKILKAILLTLSFNAMIGCADSDSTSPQKTNLKENPSCVVMAWGDETAKKMMTQMNELNLYLKSNEVSLMQESILFGSRMSQALTTEQFEVLLAKEDIELILTFLKNKRLLSAEITVADVQNCKWSK
jgi:hypothetical protein